MAPLLRRLSLVALLLLCLTGKIYAEEAENNAALPPADLPAPPNPLAPRGTESNKSDPRWTVTAECQMLLVPQKIAFGLIRELGDDEKMETAWERVQKLVEEGQVELIARLLLRGNAGEQMSAETVENILYPSNFDPPHLPDQGAQPKDVEILKAWPAVGVTPTSFESRDVGQKLELEATVSDDGRWIDASVVAGLTRLLRWMKFDAGRMADGERITLEQPCFHNMRNASGLRMRNGQRVLLGVHRVSGTDEKSFELFVLHVKATQNAALK